MQAEHTMNGIVARSSLVAMPTAVDGQNAVSKRKWLRPPKYDRLHSAILAFEEEWAMGTLEAQRQAHASKVAELVAAARAELNEGHYHGGWACLQAAVRVRLLCASRPTLRAWATSVAEESESKLTGWRLESARALLSVFENEAEDAAKETAPDPALLARVRDVQWLIDGHSQNIYAKQHVILRRALALLGILFVLVASAIVLIGMSGILIVDGSGGVLSVLLVAIFGAMGASFSGLRSVFDATSKSVPEIILSGAFTCMRPLIGAAAALVVWLAQIGGVVNLGEGSPAALLLLAFVAGFSDALVVRVVGSVGKKEG